MKNIINNAISRVMKIPIMYKLVQIIIAGRGHQLLKKHLLKEVSGNVKTILDQGCGTGEYSELFKTKKYLGLDNNKLDISYAKKHYKGKFIYGNAIKMDFPDSSFDCVFAVGLHHHLDNNSVKKAIVEAIRVLKKGGKYIILDATYPRSRLNLIGFILRKMDRGKYVRKMDKMLALIPSNLKYSKLYLSSFPLDYVKLVFKKV